MTADERLEGLVKLGKFVHAIDEASLEELIIKVRQENPWFTSGSVNLALEGIRRYLDPVKLKNWVSHYTVSPRTIRQVAVVMAGNIPLAGFHDLLSVLVSGHALMAKLSSKDSVLPTFLITKLLEVEPRFESFISMPPRLKNFDAVIATGSDNSARYFNYYFGKYPHIIRKNRTSVAVLTGLENNNELETLGIDVFSYFGLGCRNVSKLFVPKGFFIESIFPAWETYHDIIHHHKYCNNYDYQKSILLVTRTPFLDGGYVMLQETERLVSPISVVYYEFYNSAEDLVSKLSANQQKIQCIVDNSGKYSKIKFGQAQSPGPEDYADQIDTLKFLTELS